MSPKILFLTCLFLAGSLLARAETTPPAQAPEAAKTIDWSLPAGIPETMREPVSQTVIVIVKFNNDGAEDSRVGTGFILRDGLIVSAAHIGNDLGFMHVTNVAVICPTDKIVFGELAAIDVVRDVMIIEADCHGETLRLNDDAVAAPNDVRACGFNFDVNDRLAQRYCVQGGLMTDAEMIKALSVLPKSQLVRQAMLKRQGAQPKKGARATVQSGNSGSPVFVDDGRVVGMAVSRIDEPRIMVFLPAEYIHHVLREFGYEK